MNWVEVSAIAAGATLVWNIIQQSVIQQLRRTNTALYKQKDELAERISKVAHEAAVRANSLDVVIAQLSVRVNTLESGQKDMIRYFDKLEAQLADTRDRVISGLASMQATIEHAHAANKRDESRN